MWSDFPTGDIWVFAKFRSYIFASLRLWCLTLWTVVSSPVMLSDDQTIVIIVVAHWLTNLIKRVVTLPRRFRLGTVCDGVVLLPLLILIILQYWLLTDLGVEKCGGRLFIETRLCHINVYLGVTDLSLGSLALFCCLWRYYSWNVFW